MTGDSKGLAARMASSGASVCERGWHHNATSLSSDPSRDEGRWETSSTIQHALDDRVPDTHQVGAASWELHNNMYAREVINERIREPGRRHGASHNSTQPTHTVLIRNSDAWHRHAREAAQVLVPHRVGWAAREAEGPVQEVETVGGVQHAEGHGVRNTRSCGLLLRALYSPVKGGLAGSEDMVGQPRL
jgi:hypothetical protein